MARLQLNSLGGKSRPNHCNRRHGFDMFLVQNDEGNPYVSGFDFSNQCSDNDDPSNFMNWLMIALYAFLPFTFLVIVLIEPDAGPIKKRQREALKAFIMKKESDAMKESESLTKSEKEDFYMTCWIKGLKIACTDY
jgi:hypothetical protein